MWDLTPYLLCNVRAVGVLSCAVVGAIGGDGSGAVEFGDRHWCGRWGFGDWFFGCSGRNLAIGFGCSGGNLAIGVGSSGGYCGGRRLNLSTRSRMMDVEVEGLDVFV